jgi:hypothetical protein
MSEQDESCADTLVEISCLCSNVNNIQVFCLLYVTFSNIPSLQGFE